MLGSRMVPGGHSVARLDGASRHCGVTSWRGFGLTVQVGHNEGYKGRLRHPAGLSGVC